MNKKFSITVLMTVYNAKNVIKKSIRSVLNQKFKSWKMIIVDNFSDDGTSNILREIIDKRIKIIKPKKHLSRVKALNFGLRHCKTDFFGILDADDEVLPRWLNDVEKFYFENKNFGALIGRFRFKYDNQKKIIKKISIPSNKVMNDYFSYTLPCAHSSSIFNLDLMRKKNILYSKNLQTGHDWNLFLTISEFKNIYLINKIWVDWYRSKNTYTGKRYIESRYDKLINLKFKTKNQINLKFKILKYYRLIMEVLAIIIYKMALIFNINK
jgi:glycosyltransferase involved in cell wall biosynthesis